MNEHIHTIISKTHNSPPGLSDIIQKDAVPLAIGGGSILGFSLADVAEVSQQIGVILGMFVVAVTLLHRIYVFWKDVKNSDKT